MDDLAARKVLLNASGLKKGRILDVGMGDCGCMSLFLAKKGFDVVGIDRSPYAIHVARKEAKNTQVKGFFEAKLANAEKLPFGDNCFDAVFAYHSLHHADNAKKVIDEMFRVCKPSGMILISEFHEKGRKVYEHEDDKGKFLIKIEKMLLKHTGAIEKIRSKYNIMFLCRK